MKKALVIIVCLAVFVGITSCDLFGPSETDPVDTPTEKDQVATPTFSPSDGIYSTAQNVIISCATSGATVYYTTNGENPTASSDQYTAAIPVSVSTTIKAFAVKSEMIDSEVASATYAITPPSKVATPIFSPLSGIYSTTQNVIISCATSGATVYYTTNGENPTASSDQYTAAIQVSETTTIKVFAVKSEMIDSEIASATYTIATPSIVGEWLINQTYLMYTDTPPDTVSITQNITTIMNADGTYTMSGTTRWDVSPPETVEGSGTYTYDEGAGTLELAVLTFLLDGVPQAFTGWTYNCELTETTMTFSSPWIQQSYPAEPIVYTRQ